MMNAEVGDDVFEDDPVIHLGKWLQMFGKEAGLFVHLLYD